MWSILRIFFGKKKKRTQTWPSPSPWRSHRPIETPPWPETKPYDSSSSSTLDTPVVLKGRARVIDGDTIVISKTQIRLFGIDAPEIDHPYGQKSKWTLVSLVKGKDVTAEVTATDDYGRTVAKCYLPDKCDLSAEMVKLGMAIDWPKFSDGVYRKFETSDARKKLWLADARQKGRMHVWKNFKPRGKGS